MELSLSHKESIAFLSSELRVKESYDIIERHMRVAGEDVCFFYVDGFTKDAEMQRLMQYLLSQKSLGGAKELVEILPYVEVELGRGVERIVTAVLSGQTALLSSSFPGEAILIDARTYPARSTAEPDTDRVMQGSRDGFVETLVMNTALIRRRIRDPRLTMRHFDLGGSSHTDVVMCYVEGVADEKLVNELSDKLKKIKPKGVCLGYRSISESLIRHGWLNPFPKIRLTERPDTASAQLLEGSVLIICDTSPQVMIFPTSIFDYLQQTDDYYFPPLTGSYLRIVRTVILILSVMVTPVWYLCVEFSDTLPDYLRFLVPDSPGALPIILQLLLIEVAIDGLKIASMNTPDMLSNSLSVVGALLLGDFAVGVGWVCEDVILYMAFVSIASFAQQNVELGYAFKFVRVAMLIAVYFLGAWGLLAGAVLFALLLITNVTVSGRFRYLYPLVPFNPRALLHLLFRVKKRDFGEK
ncbi:MAG: spore germination protein [Clostridia bacterium]|nr:spore germination protein [Clostridia bacterium]